MPGPTDRTRPLADYVPRFEAMVRALEADPDVLVLNAFVGPPLSEAALADLEQRWGGPLSPALRDLYRQADGLTLRWIRMDNPRFDPSRHHVRTGRAGYGDPVADDDACDGALLLLPLEEVLFADRRDQLIHDFHTDDATVSFAGETWGERAFREALRVVDWFSAPNMAALVMRPGEPEGPVILGDDHGASFTDSRRISFETYMEGQLRSFARVDTRRRTLIKLFGHREPPVLDWPEVPLFDGPTARRVWYATAEGAFRREGDGWVREGDGLREVLAEKGRKQTITALAVDPDGALLVANTRSAWRMTPDGGFERICGGPQSAYARNLACAADGTVALGLSERVILARPGKKPTTFTQKKALGGSNVMNLCFTPDGTLVVGLWMALTFIHPDDTHRLEPFSLPPTDGHRTGAPMDLLWVEEDGAIGALHYGHLGRRAPDGTWRWRYIGEGVSYSGLVEVEGVGRVLTSYGLQGRVLRQRAPDQPFEDWPEGAALADHAPACAVPDGAGGALVALGSGDLGRITAEGAERVRWQAPAPETLSQTDLYMAFGRLARGPDGALRMAGERAIVAARLL
ncbi:MAG: SMI1/KNR4 family protein [Alphaproteobacteria bacterium]|nr:SMI1/KNR4 family protein [Alphaproteobacteria bacterium]